MFMYAKLLSLSKQTRPEQCITTVFKYKSSEQKIHIQLFYFLFNDIQFRQLIQLLLRTMCAKCFLKLQDNLKNNIIGLTGVKISPVFYRNSGDQGTTKMSAFHD